MKVRIASAGFLTSIQDLGRTGYRQSGVSLGGALDAHALRVANAIVGNEENAAGVEATLGTLRLQFDDERLVAWAGGAFSVQIEEADLPAGHAGLIQKNQELKLTAPNTGGRAWLAISGGLDLPLVLGSRSTDLRGNFGGHKGRALKDQDELPLGQGSRLTERRFPNSRADKTDNLEMTSAWISDWCAPANWAAIGHDNAVLRIVRGTNWDRFTSDARESFLAASFSVTRDSDRMGARLDGPKLDCIEEGDLLSEAIAPGTVQVPPNGKPILLLADCQTIGGYPRIGHVITVDLPVAAQLSPGSAVRFQEVSLAQGQDLLRQREEDFARFRVGLSLHFR
ncbi:MAG TPA: biotin-dependent carboxyltransferase family protein [Chthoniobacterales bacterium]